MWVTEHRTGNGTYKTYSEEPPKNFNTSWQNWLLSKQPISSFSSMVNDYKTSNDVISKKKSNKRKK